MEGLASRVLTPLRFTGLNRKRGENLGARNQQDGSRHVSVSSFDGVVTEVGTLEGPVTGETHVIRCHRVAVTDSGMLDFGALQDPQLFSGFRYQDDQWSFIMRKRSHSKD
jgi:hypothetical protein